MYKFNFENNSYSLVGASNDIKSNRDCVIIPAMNNGLEGEWPVTIIGSDVFANSDFPEVVIPNSVKHIGASAFYNCRLSGKLVIPEGVESIGDFAFAFTRIEYVVLPASLKYLGENAFLYCNNLVLIAHSVATIICKNAFNGCTSLKDVVAV